MQGESPRQCRYPLSESDFYIFKLNYFTKLSWNWIDVRQRGFIGWSNAGACKYANCAPQLIKEGDTCRLAANIKLIKLFLENITMFSKMQKWKVTFVIFEKMLLFIFFYIIFVTRIKENMRSSGLERSE